MQIEKNKSLKEYTTWKVGGPADFFIEAKSKKDIQNAINFAKEEKLPFVVIGNGSNILINDKGFRGIVIKISNNNIKSNNNIVYCDAGLKLSQFIKFTKDNNLYGAEFLWGIPGTVGGAIVGNAGMNNKEIKDILIKIIAINKNGDILNINKEDIKFSYRNSSLKKKDNLIIISCEFKLQNKKFEENNDLSKKRLNQPKGLSAGSVFKNPKKNLFAGKLIEDAKLKGKIINGAEISKEHGNFILNINNAKATDIIKLIKLIQDKVKNKFSVQLKREIRILGEKGWE